MSDTKLKRDLKVLVRVYLQNVLHLVAHVHVLLVVVDLRVVSDQGVLGADVDGVVDLPVDVPHFASRMEQTLRTTSRGSVQSDGSPPDRTWVQVLTCRQYCSMRQGPMATLSPSRAPMTAWMT